MSARNGRWKDGNRFTLLENGEAFFPAVLAAIEAARREVIIETFILFDDKVGSALQQVLIAAGRRGVQVDLTVDGFGSPNLSPEFVGALTAAGVRFHVFDPAAPFLGVRVNVFRRMHRKLVVVDGVRAFVGGLNFSADHLLDFGPEAKQDYAVEVEGPIVEDIHRFATEQLEPQGGARRWFRRWGQRAAPRAPQRAAGNAQALFVTRDNVEHHTDIERHYRIAIRAARREVLIANAYFFPGYRLLKEMRKAARRGVRVRLILQGEPDMAIVKTAANALYDHLLRAGVQIYEYCERPLHAKVALTDDEWATVGSSNLDPLSLSLNLEANVVIRDRAFNQQLRERLEHLIAHACEEVQASPTKLRLWEVVRFFFVYHFLRRYPSWAGWLPAHVPRLSSAPTGSAKAEAGTSAVEPMALSPTDAPRELAER